MSMNGRLKQAAHPAAPLQWVRANVVGYFALFRRKPRFEATPAWRTPRRLAVGTVVVIAVIAATMIAVDARAVGVVQRLPAPLIEMFDQVTHLRPCPAGYLPRSPCDSVFCSWRSVCLA